MEKSTSTPDSLQHSGPQLDSESSRGELDAVQGKDRIIDGNVLYRKRPLPLGSFTRAVNRAADMIRKRPFRTESGQGTRCAFLAPIRRDPRLEQLLQRPIGAKFRILSG